MRENMEGTRCYYLPGVGKSTRDLPEASRIGDLELVKIREQSVLAMHGIIQLSERIIELLLGQKVASSTGTLIDPISSGLGIGFRSFGDTKNTDQFGYGMKWEKDVQFQDGDRVWVAASSNYQVAIVNSYRHYTSSDFLIRVIQGLCSLFPGSVIAATFGRDGIQEDYIFHEPDLSDLGRVFNQTGWGVWAIASGGVPPRALDLIELLNFVEPGLFAIYIDLDDGMVVGCPLIGDNIPLLDTGS